MSVMYITEYAELAFDSQGKVIQAGKEPAVTTQKFTFTVTAGASAAFNANTNFIRISADGAGYLAFGTAPTAVTTTGSPIQANTPEYFGVVPGQKISAVT